VFEHLATRNQVEDEVEVVVILVHVSEAGYVGMAAVVVDSEQRIGLRLESRSARVPPTDLLEGDLGEAQRTCKGEN